LGDGKPKNESHLSNAMAARSMVDSRWEKENDSVQVEGMEATELEMGA
jgi:hypothetical protein